MFSDLKLATRSWLKTPGFTAIAVFTLALGIGATTAIFSLVNTVLLRPLPYAQPQQLARIYAELPNFPNGGLRRLFASTPEYLAVRRETQSWQSIDAWTPSGANIGTTGEPIRVTASFITGGLLETLGVAPTLGRLITPQDDEPGAPLVAVISHPLWQRAFAGERTILGRVILLNGKKHTVVGVMPKEFSFPFGEADASEVWVPLQIDPSVPVHDHSVYLLGRLKPDMTLHQAQAELDSFVEHQAQTVSGHHLDPKDHPLVAYDLRDEVVRNVRPALRMLFAAVCFLLLIACLNVANLLLTRAEARQREVAIRGALGAGLWRLARQFATEGILLSLTGAVLGLLLAQVGLQLIESAGAVGIPQAVNTVIDGPVLLFAVSMTLLTGLAFALAPLAYIIKRNLHSVMKSSAASTTDASGAQRVRQLLIVGQLALALILLTGTGLMLRAFWKLQQVDGGFDPNGVMTMAVALPDSVYPDEAAPKFWTQLRERLARIPAVEGASLTSALPPVADDKGWGTRIEGFVPAKGGPIPGVADGGDPSAVIDHYQAVSPNYFDTLKVRLVAGRFFDARDDAQAAKVVIINQTLARAIWGNESALGHRVQSSFSSDWSTIVGVIADVKNNGLDNPTGTALYLPYMQVPAFAGILRRPYIAVRSQSAPSSTVSAVRRVLRELDPALPLAKVRTMDEVMSASQSRPRFLALLLTLFASVSLVLAAVGIYGVISYSVAQRTKELGVRIALGAQHEAILSLVLGRGLLLTICGLAVGLAGALALTRFLSGFLFGITATDPATFATVSMLLGMIALVATYLPARRATKIDPLVALRTE